MRLRLRERFGTPEWIRTTGPQLRRLLLYPAELRAHNRTSKIRVFLQKNKFILDKMIFFRIFESGPSPVWLRQAQFRQVRKEAAVSLLLGYISTWSLFFYI